LEGSTGEMCGEDKFIRENSGGREEEKRLEEDLFLYFCLTLM
jgi:hypothetical protein